MAHIYRTSVGTVTNSNRWVFSAWIKRGSVSTSSPQGIISTSQDNTNYAAVLFNQNNDKMYYKEIVAGSQKELGAGTGIEFRDVNAWMHLFMEVDTSQATASNRAKLFINGVDIGWGSGTGVNQNTASGMQRANATFNIGMAKISGTEHPFEGSMSYVYYIDGAAYGTYSASDFGETDSTDGMWKIKTNPTIASYGNNGFLVLKDGSTITDQSPNSNNFTASGTITNTKDCPDNNFCTMNPLDNYWFGGTFSNGNTVTVSPSSPYAMCTSTLGMSSGKYYAEAKLQAGYPQLKFGISCRPAQVSNETMAFSGSTCYSGSDGTLVLDGVTDTGWGSTFSVGDIIGIAVDCDNNRIYFSVNGTWQNSANPSSGSGYETIVAPASTSTGFYHFAWSDNKTNGGSTMQYNFGNGYFGTTAITSAGTNASGNGTFEYDVPTGFTALCTKGINS